ICGSLTLGVRTRTREVRPSIDNVRRIMNAPSLRGDFGGLILSRRIVRYITQLGFVIVAGVLLVFAGYRLTSLWLVPEVTVAIAKADADFTPLIAALARNTDASVLKIHLSELPDAAAVDAAFERKAADFALVRPDIDFPADAMVAAVLQENPLVVLSFEAAKLTRVEQLAGKRIGAIDLDTGAQATLRRVLEYNQAADSEISQINADQVRAAITGKRIDAMAISGNPSKVRRLVKDLADLKPVIVPLPAADIPQSMPGVGSATIAAKSLPGGIPEEEAQTVATSILLVARRDVDRATVNTFLHSLFSRRPTLARDSELAWQMKGPEDETTFAKLPNHRGALDYYNREQQTFMDLYGDWIWLGLFAAGGFSSAGAWLTQMLSRRRKQLVENILDRLLEILGEARDAQDVETLDRLTLEIDGLVTHAIRQARWRATEPVTTSALTLAIDSSRAAIADRRRALVASGGVRTPLVARLASP
ncbi:MAG: TAXI family TRAP transporter solute-binding subunit, partial [Pseudorhodoplanes sp.]